MATPNAENVSILCANICRSFVKGLSSAKKDIYHTTHIIAPRPEPEPECRVDRDCPSQMACIDERCQNPCRVANPCTGSQQCLVTDTLPTRTVACACPQGFVFGSNGECKQGKIQTHLT